MTQIRLFVSRILVPVDRIFNRIYTSRFNPIYRSGSIAVLLFTIVVVTGVYLIFFYSLSDPYSSIQTIHSQVFLGRWIRSVHRYASDATLIAAFFHALRMIAQGKSWGPRTLAWSTGIGLILLMFISGWTGFVMVWDMQAQAMAMAFVRAIDSLEIIPDSLSHSFSGSVSPGASFFFFLLFLHIVVPLALIFAIWLHTSRMARATWFPHRAMGYAVTGLVVFIAIVYPAPLGESANLLRQVNHYESSLLFGFWVPFALKSPGTALALGASGIALLTGVMLISRPVKGRQPEKAFNDPNLCLGCGQCAQDCPYEAIQMIPRPPKAGKLPAFAQVNPNRCVGCSICSASCSAFTMGPIRNKGPDQIDHVKSFIQKHSEKSRVTPLTVILGCKNQPETLDRIKGFSNHHPDFVVYPIGCAGTIHAVVIEELAKSFSKVIIAACPEQNCSNKDGHRLISERAAGDRAPRVSKRFGPERVEVLSVGDGEEFQLIRYLEGTVPSVDRNGLALRMTSIISGAALMFVIAYSSHFSFGAPSDMGIIRLNLKLKALTERKCRTRTQDELDTLPIHMRSNEVCIEQRFGYQLVLKVDGEPMAEELILPGGLRHDRPIYYMRDLPFSPGSRQINLELIPTNPSAESDGLMGLNRNVSVRAGWISLIEYSQDSKSLTITEGRQ